MINLAYIYKNEDKAIQIRDEFISDYTDPVEIRWCSGRKHVYYEDVTITFLNYKCIENIVGYNFHDIYIEPQLLAELTYKQLTKIKSNKRNTCLPKELTRVKIDDICLNSLIE